LIEAGADINAHNKAGVTSLMCAAALNSNSEVIMTLLKAGADVKAKDRIQKTALDWALGNPELQGSNALKKLEEASR
jgi:ankyrin repeat protein